MTGIELIQAERQRQIDVEKWTPEHDDKHDAGELVAAAATYALEATFDGPAVKRGWFNQFWMFDDAWFKPGTKVRMLTKAGALIAAEIDRLQRAKKDHPIEVRVASDTTAVSDCSPSAWR